MDVTQEHTYGGKDFEVPWVIRKLAIVAYVKCKQGEFESIADFTENNVCLRVKVTGRKIDYAKEYVLTIGD